MVPSTASSSGGSESSCQKPASAASPRTRSRHPRASVRRSVAMVYSRRWRRTMGFIMTPQCDRRCAQVLVIAAWRDVDVAQTGQRRRHLRDRKPHKIKHPPAPESASSGCWMKLRVSPGSGTGRAGRTRRGFRRRPHRACRRGRERGGGRTAALRRREGQRVHMLARRSGHSGRSRSELESVGKRYLSRLPPTVGRPQSFRAVTRTHQSCTMPVLPAFKPFGDARTLTDMERFEIATCSLRAAGAEDDVVPGRHRAAALAGLAGRTCGPLGRLRRRVGVVGLVAG